MLQIYSRKKIFVKSDIIYYLLLLLDFLSKNASISFKVHTVISTDLNFLQRPKNREFTGQ